MKALKKTPVAYRQHAAERARKWRAENPDKARAIKLRFLAKHPKTAEDRALDCLRHKQYREKNRKKVNQRRAEKRALVRDAANAKRRALYAKNIDARRAQRADYVRRNPDYPRRFLIKHADEYRGDGRWSKRTRRMHSAWRSFTQTCAANRRARETR